MELRPFGPVDADALTTYTEIAERVRQSDSPWEHPVTRPWVEGRFRYGWDLNPDKPFLAVVDGTAVGFAAHTVNVYDNLDFAWIDVAIDPEYRRRGHGTAALDLMLEHLRGLGITSYGIGAWDAEGPRAFAARRGLEPKIFSANRRQVIAELDWERLDALYAEAQAAAADYEVIRREGATPEEELEAMAVMVAAINDAPRDDLEMEDEAFPPERVRAYEEAQMHQGLLHRVIARHRTRGELAGQTVVMVQGDLPHVGHQEDTSVLAAHRGHKLGMLLKIDMLRWLRDEQPQLLTIDTWNAVSNDFMISVNEAMGYRLLGTSVGYQDTL